MEFVDNRGHIFSLTDYNTYPDGYLFNDHPYVFWMNDKNGTDLSVNCYYIQPIRILLEKAEENQRRDIEILIEKSNHYKLLSSVKVQELMEKNSFLMQDIEIDEAEDLTQKLTTDDLLQIEINEVRYKYIENGKNYFYYGDPKETDKELIEYRLDYVMIPFYVVSKVKETGSWLTNVLIHTTDNFSVKKVNGIIDTENDDVVKHFYCPITVGGVYHDEIEELAINGKNMGVSLPKDIMRSIYSVGFFNNVPDMNKWNQKMKEFLMNYMLFVGEKGNFRSIEKSLDWFGYNKKISLSKLIKTDNEFQKQYILDNFDLTTDLISAFKYFRNATYVSLSMTKVGYDENNVPEYNFDEDFWGEHKPELVDYFNKTEEIELDNGIKYYKTYYDYSFNELSLKLSALKYYYQKYFLPIHIKIFRASFTEQTFANDVKLLNTSTSGISEIPLLNADKNISVQFNSLNTLWFSKQLHFVDDNYNEFSNYAEIGNNFTDINIYEINEVCFSIPIKISSSLQSTVFNCVLMLYKDSTKIHESHFMYANDKMELNSLVITPSLFRHITDWEDSQYHIVLGINGNWYDWEFEVKVPELHIELGKLEYKYEYDIHKQFNGKDENGRIKWNASIYEPDVVTIDNINYISQLTDYAKQNCLQYIDGNELYKDKVFYYYYCENGNQHIITLETNVNGKIQYDDRITIEKTAFSGNSRKLYKIDKKHNCTLNCKFYQDGKCSKYKGETCNLLFLDKNGNISVSESLPGHATIYSSLYKNLSSFVDIYRSNVNVPTNKNRMNKVYIYDLFTMKDNQKQPVKYDTGSWQPNYDENDNFSIELGDLEVMYDINGSDNVLNLYSKIFDDNGDWNKDLYKIDESNKWVKSLNHERQLFDIYLMHDTKLWYVVFISKDTVGNNPSKYLDLNTSYRIGEEIKNDETGEILNLFLIRKNVGEKFLINRMEFIDSEGINHFKDNDLVVCKLRNGDGLQIKSQIGSRWNITPLSFSINDKTIIESNNNMAIISIGDNLKYEPGYYEINVKYSLDNYLNTYQETSTKFRIDK
jgi:hypothetical protein